MQPSLDEPGKASFWMVPRQWFAEQHLSPEFWAFFMAAFFFDAGFAVYFFLFNLYLLDLHFSERMMGLAGGALTLGSMLGTLPGGLLVRRFGLRPLLLTCFIAAPTLGVLRVFLVAPAGQIALAFAGGVAMCLWGVCFLPAVAHFTTEKNRAAGFGLIFSVSVGTAALGGLVCGYLPRWLAAAGIHYQPAQVKQFILLAACVIASLAIFPLWKLRVSTAAIEEDARHDWRRYLELPVFLRRFLPLMAVWSAIAAATTPFVNVYLTRDLGVPLLSIGMLFSVAQVLQLLTGMLTPFIFRSLGLLRGIVATQLLAAAGLALFASAHSGRWAIAAFLGFSAAQWMAAPGLYNLLMSETPEVHRGTAAALTLCCNALVAAAATACAGLLFARNGYPPVLAGLAVIAGVTSLLFLRLQSRVRGTGEESVSPTKAAVVAGLCLLLGCSSRVCAQAAHGADLYCHRTANEDVPENTLESLEQAALLGCNVIEIDVRRTLDGKLVLNHDGFLERLTDGDGEVETSLLGDLQRRNAGSWMSERFAGLRIVRLEDALRLARERHVRLILDIKTKGIGPEVLSTLKQEQMLANVSYNGEWDDIREALSQPGSAVAETWLQPGVTAERVAELHRQGKRVIVNFSANAFGLDVLSMRAAVSAGADGINVDYPRLGADAVGRPVEETIARLVHTANSGDISIRTAAILELARFHGFDLQADFAHWAADPEDSVSRAASLALVAGRPPASWTAFTEARTSPSAAARANAAWGMGQVNAPPKEIMGLLNDSDAHVQQEALLSLARVRGPVPLPTLLRLAGHRDPAVRGAAAVALAKHDPPAARRIIPQLLGREVKDERAVFDQWVRRGKPTLTAGEIEQITDAYRCQMTMMHALSALHSPGVTAALEREAFRGGDDFSQVNGLVAAFQLWDRAADDPAPVIAALSAGDTNVADKAEWILVHAGPRVLPAVRATLDDRRNLVRERAVRVLAWQGDREALSSLQRLGERDAAHVELIRWAVGHIQASQSAPSARTR